MGMRAFQTAKQALSDATLLFHPNGKAVTEVTCDASGTAVGASLDQLIDGEWKPLAFFSRKLSHAELEYRELLAIYLSTKHLRYFLEGRRFAIYTDHFPLTTAIASAADRSPRQARHLSYVAEFTNDLHHLPGKSNVVADALSRSCTELNAVLVSPIDFRDMATDQQTDPDSIYYKDKVDTGMVLWEVNIRGIKLLHRDAPDFSFQHHGVRRCLTLSTVSPIWVRSPLSRQSPVKCLALHAQGYHQLMQVVPGLSSEQGWPTYSRPPARLHGAERPFRQSPCGHCRPPSTLSGLYLSLHRHRQIHPLD